MSDLATSMGLNFNQKLLLFSNLDSILSQKQHQQFQESCQLSISSSARLVRINF